MHNLKCTYCAYAKPKFFLFFQAGTPLMILAGKDYGSGSSRDWAAKGPFLLGVKAVLAESYERIHRSNLVRARKCFPFRVRLMLLACHKKSYLICDEITNFRKIM